MSVKGKQGGCLCGDIRYEMKAEPMFIQSCHCLDCQRLSGGAFITNMWTETDSDDHLQGMLSSVSHTTASGNQHEVHSCSRCSVDVWSQYHKGLKGTLFVRAGTLDDPIDVKPMAHIYTRSKQDWLDLGSHIPVFEEFYDLKTTWPKESLLRAQALTQPNN